MFSEAVSGPFMLECARVHRMRAGSWRTGCENDEVWALKESTGSLHFRFDVDNSDPLP